LETNNQAIPIINYQHGNVESILSLITGAKVLSFLQTAKFFYVFFRFIYLGIGLKFGTFAKRNLPGFLIGSSAFALMFQKKVLL